MALRVAWYRLRTTWHRRWADYVVIALLIGAVGGLGLGAIAGARRTQSAFPGYLAETNASDLQVGIIPRAATAPAEYSPALTAVLTRLPHVRRVGAFPFIFALPMKPDGAPAFPDPLNNNEVSTIGTVNREYFDQDRVAVSQGRMANPGRSDEFVMTTEAAKLLHWRVGQVITFGVFTSAQGDLRGFGTAKVQPTYRVAAKLVGLVMFASQVVRDEADQYPTFLLFTPAFTDHVLSRASYFPTYALTLTGGSRDLTTAEQEVLAHLPKGYATSFHVTSVVDGQVERATRPESIALGIFGVIAVLAALLIAAQAMGRQQLSRGRDLDVLRALGANQAMTIADALLGGGAAIVIGAALATTVAVALSPFTLIGPVRQLERSPGFAFDWTVLGGGAAVLIGGLFGFALMTAFRNAPQRTAARRRTQQVSPASRVAAAAGAGGMPASAVTGLRFALERGRGSTAAPVRSALVGTILAVSVVAATLTFGSGLHTLVSHPRLYGWNWTYAIDEAGSGKFPEVGQNLLTHDHDVAAWTGFNFADIQIDGQTIPTLLAQPNAALTPSMLSGHAIQANDQIVLGAATLAQLHKHLGDTVVAGYGSAKSGAAAYVPPTRLRIVGTATLPAVGNQGTLHPSMGTGAVISNNVGPAPFKRAGINSDPLQNGVRLAVVRLRSTIPPATGLASLRAIATAVTKRVDADQNVGSGTFQVLPVQQPAEIVSYQHTGNTPEVLAAGLAAGSVLALALTLAASVRRRRRDLALLKAIGFTRRQLLATIAWQASISALIGLLVGIPVGIGFGRWLWILFAREIYAVAQPTVPWLQIVLIAVGALLLANAAALLPGRDAARTRTSQLLSAD